MPDPRPLGNVARTVVNSLRDMEREDMNDALALAAAIGKGETEKALAIAERIARRNADTFSALTYLGADLLSKAEEAVMDAKRRLQK